MDQQEDFENVLEKMSEELKRLCHKYGLQTKVIISAHNSIGGFESIKAFTNGEKSTPRTTVRLISTDQAWADSL